MSDGLPAARANLASSTVNGPVVVSALSATPVKGTRVTPRTELVLDRFGVADNRRFYVIDARGRMVNGKQFGALTEIVADYEPATSRLTMNFPDGSAVAGEVVLESLIGTSFFSRPVSAHPVSGPWSDALSAHVGQALRLVQGDGRRPGVDRGRAGAVSLVGRASLAALAASAGQPAIDARRLRMLIELSGSAPYAEDTWVERRLRIGQVVVAVHGHVGRCLVTNRHPDTGAVDLPMLDMLRAYRGDVSGTEPMPLGVYAEVLQAGTVRLGDTVEAV